MKSKFRQEFIPILIIVAAIIAGLVAYPSLPAQVASHWNFQGSVDGWNSKNFSVFFLPILLVIMYALFLFLPLIDPKKQNYGKFSDTYNWFKILIIFALFVIYAATIAFNLGFPIDVSLVVSAVIGFMIMIIGFALPRIKENWFIGIRTPWTLSSPTVWEKTHKVGGKLFIIFGLTIVLAPYIAWPYGVILFMAGALVAVLGTIIYSYVAYSQEERNK
jgi:uncharacterized membrane protein